MHRNIASTEKTISKTVNSYENLIITSSKKTCGVLPGLYLSRLRTTLEVLISYRLQGKSKIDNVTNWVAFIATQR